MICDAARTARIPVSLCGEMAGDTQYTPILLALGLTQLSMNPGSIPRVKRLVRELRQDDCEELLAEAFSCATHEDMSALVHAFLHSKTSLRLDAGSELEAEPLDA